MLLPMSPLDSMFLLGESREHPMHVGGVQVFQPPEGADARDMRALLDAALTDTDQDVASRLGRRARRSWTSLGQWGWESDTRIDLGHHVRHDALPEPGEEAQLLALCSRLHSTPLDRSRPLWEIHLIEGLRDGRYATYTKIHHAVADGVSAMTMLRRALSEDPDERGMRAPWQHSRPRHPGPAVDAVEAVDLPRAVIHAARSTVGEFAGLVPALARTLTRAAREQGGPLSLAAPKTMFNVPISGSRQFAAQSWPLERLRLVAKLADATINDVVLAMSAGALRSYLLEQDALPAEPLVAMVPVSLRDEKQAATGERGGNDVGVLMCNLGTHLPEPADRLDTVRTCMREGKQAMAAMSGAQILAMSALGAGPAGASIVFGHNSRLRPPFNLIISNVPGPRHPLYWNGARLDGLYPLSIPVDGQGLNITCTSNDDTISFGITGCRRAVPQLHTLTTHLGDALRALEHAAGI